MVRIGAEEERKFLYWHLFFARLTSIPLFQTLKSYHVLWQLVGFRDCDSYNPVYRHLDTGDRKWGGYNRNMNETHIEGRVSAVSIRFTSQAF